MTKSVNVAKLGSDMSKNEIRLLSPTSLKTHLQMVQELQQVILESGSGTRKGSLVSLV